MVRTYKKKLGTRAYRNFSDESLENALEKVVDHNWSLSKAAKEYSIPYGTLYNKYHGLHHKKRGGQPVFTIDEEKTIINAAVICSDWGMPITVQDFQMITKNFWDRHGSQIKQFKNNMPGVDWVQSLLKRHSNDLTKRLAANITKVRAAVSVNTIKEYFSNLSESIKDVPPENLFNYDETNLADDPGKRQILCRRGTKYPENIINFSKSAITVMFCGSASGILLPPYVIYKADNIWDRWTENGPKGSPCCTDRCCSSGSRYNRSKSGWMDASIFTDWFSSVFLPHATRLPGKEVIIGDNLPAHLTDEVIHMCQQNNIAFLFLPKNSTHLTQPLDIAFFRPLKTSWRKILLQYKMGSKNASIPKKEDFPHLLKQTLQVMDNFEKNGERNSIKRDLISGFSACGIVPLDPDKILKRFPDEKGNESFTEDFNASLITFLKDKRYNATPNRAAPRKKRRINIAPGKSVADDSSDEDDPVLEEEMDEQTEEIEEEVVDSRELEEEVEYEEVNPQILDYGSFVLVKFTGGKRNTVSYRYVAIVQEKLPNQNLRMMGLKSMDTAKKVFKVDESDVFEVTQDDVVAILPSPKIQQSGQRLKYIFPKSVDVYEK